MGGHSCTDKTLGYLKERFYWPGCHNNVKEWCPTLPQLQHANLHQPNLVHPCNLWSQATLAGNSYILVAADYFMYYTMAYLIKNQEATTVASKFFFPVFTPACLHSNQGQNFEPTVTEVCKLLGVDKSRSTPYHPKLDRLVEWFNHTLSNMLATAVRNRLNGNNTCIASVLHTTLAYIL